MTGRSLTAWQGFSLTRWYFDDPVNSVWQTIRRCSAR